MSQAFMSIATHDGQFHTDETLAIAILTTIFKNNEIVRTRDQEIVAECDFAVDVGDVYNHTLRRYDHHMKNPPTDELGHIYSSAGLIWKHYADAYLAAIGIPKLYSFEGLSVDLRSEVKTAILNRWIIIIDKIDNGELTGPSVISEVVKAMRPVFHERTRDNYDEQFKKTVAIIASVLERTCFHIVDFTIKRAKFMRVNKTLLSDGRIMVSDREVPTINQYCGTTIKFVIFPSQEYVDEETEKWIINPVPISPHRSVASLIDARLLGAREETIQKITGISGVYYVHHTGFVIFANLQQEAIAFCEFLLENQSVQ